MKHNFLFLILLLCTAFSQAQSLSSPDHKIRVDVAVSSGQPVYSIYFNKVPVLQKSALGVDINDLSFHDQLKTSSVSPVQTTEAHYNMLNAKKREITYKANKRTFIWSNVQGKKIGVTFQVSNDGVAFRYEFTGKQDLLSTVNKEYTSYHFPETAKAWLQHKAEAQTGWEHTNPSYEENYQQDVAIGTFSKTGWVYPALFKSNDVWMAITEAGMDGKYCGTFIKNEPDSPVYQITFPDTREVFAGKGSLPESKGPWTSPWRIIAIGSLKTVMESTLGTDLALPAISLKDASFIKPGQASWSWIMSKDEFITYEEQKKYIDYAADMKWAYTLIDVDWDTKIGYEKVTELAAYAAKKNVGLLLWYNSAGSWNTVPYHPKNKLLTHESRVEEFSRLQKMGIKGVKIDFFNGDGRSMIAYYTEILKDAADYQLLVNFHGATLPRGWARTYPHLMTTEAVKGFEMVTFMQEAADMEATHAAMLPFTRNLFDPMDFTPMNLYKIPTNVVRKTTSAFELATSVLFLSGIQHYAESPEGMAKVPADVKTFLSSLPVHWDEVKFIDGLPGKLVVIARRSGSKWYVAGINGENKPKKVLLDLSALKMAKATLFNDGKEPLSFDISEVNTAQKYEVELKGNGGFVLAQ
ncbi:glycoside hydrolase family 97 protein [Pedobacter nutrimenti]|uniref:glycoside hydrolase family 97 protein n=1 Tax=Pedobacter nutrimenti TaxID=1241337 RepID=UPI00292DE7CD|nr:glycoside hydrolase family 97 catalytic domain-containing protein [Pedobacter nutrimenti]